MHDLMLVSVCARVPEFTHALDVAHGRIPSVLDVLRGVVHVDEVALD